MFLSRLNKLASSSILKLKKTNTIIKCIQRKEFSSVPSNSPPNSTEKDDSPAEPTLFHFSLVTIFSYTTIYFTTLGGCFVGVQSGLIDCSMFSIHPDYCVQQFLESFPKGTFTPQDVSDNQTLHNFIHAFGINRFLKVPRAVLTLFASFGLNQALGIPDQKYNIMLPMIIYPMFLLEPWSMEDILVE